MTNKQTRKKPTGVSLGVVAAAAFALLVTAAPAGAQAGASSPRDALDSFTFTSEVSADSGDATEPAMSITATGTYVAPASQDCRIRVRVQGLEMTQHLVVVDHEYWLDKGDGFMRVRRGDVTEFADACPSAPSFWAHFPSFPVGLGGTPEVHNGVKSEHLDLSETAAAVTNALGSLPSGVAIDTVDLHVAAKGRWLVGAEVRLVGATADSCQSFGTDGSGIDLAAPCAVERHIEIRRPNARSNTVKLPRSVEQARSRIE
jgi:hypothetical protein